MKLHGSQESCITAQVHRATKPNTNTKSKSQPMTNITLETNTCVPIAPLVFIPLKGLFHSETWLSCVLSGKESSSNMLKKECMDQILRHIACLSCLSYLLPCDLNQAPHANQAHHVIDMIQNKYASPTAAALAFLCRK